MTRSRFTPAQTSEETHASHPAKKAAAKKAAPAKSAVQATITLKHLAAALADSHEIAKKQAEAVLGDLVTLTTRHLKKGDKIRLTGLGILQVRKRAATDGTESGDRRDHQDQGEQEGRIPACQGTERGGVGRSIWGQQSPGTPNVSARCSTVTRRAVADGLPIRDDFGDMRRSYFAQTAPTFVDGDYTAYESYSQRVSHSGRPTRLGWLP